MTEPIRLVFPGRLRAWATFHLPFVRGGDGLTCRQRRAFARHYWTTALRTFPEDVERLRRRLSETQAFRRGESVEGDPDHL